MILARDGPTPNTVCVAFFQRSQTLQSAAACRRAAIVRALAAILVVRLVSLVGGRNRSGLVLETPIGSHQMLTLDLGAAFGVGCAAASGGCKAVNHSE